MLRNFLQQRCLKNTTVCPLLSYKTTEVMAHTARHMHRPTSNLNQGMRVAIGISHEHDH